MSSGFKMWQGANKSSIKKCPFFNRLVCSDHAWSKQNKTKKKGKKKERKKNKLVGSRTRLKAPVFLPLAILVFCETWPAINSIQLPLRHDANVPICNGNRSEWSPIRSVIIRVITKSDYRAAGIRFVYHEYAFRPNWTTRSPIPN